MNNQVDKIKEKIFNLTRNHIKKSLTGNLGKVVEEEDKLVCYVRKNKCKKEKFDYTIDCHNIRKKDQELAQKYNLDKPICYIIDGLEFQKDEVYIFGYNNCEVIIRNCIFDFGLHINVNGKCTLENTFIRTVSSYLTLGATEFIVKDMNVYSFVFYPSKNLNVILGADKKLEIINSELCKSSNKANITLVSGDELNIISSTISGNTVEYKGNKLTSDSHSFAIASEKLKLEIKEFKKLNVTTPVIVYNEDTFLNKTLLPTTIYQNNLPLNKTKSDTSSKISDLKQARLNLVKTLKYLRNECIKVNKEKISEYKTNLNNQSLSKTLKNNK